LVEYLRLRPAIRVQVAPVQVRLEIFLGRRVICVRRQRFLLQLRRDTAGAGAESAGALRKLHGDP